MVFEYAPAPESTKIVDLKSNYKLFIGGKFINSNGAKTYKTINPATEEVLAEIIEASQKDVDLAVKSARKAFKTWSKLTGSQRGKYLFRLARIIQERSRELAVLESMNNGKPIRESRDIDIPLVAAHFFHYAGWADKLDYAGLGKNPAPLGVAGQIIPWNFHYLCLLGKLRLHLQQEIQLF